MIKKLFITFLAVLYLGVSSGATLHYQYCMGTLMKVTLWHGESQKCHTCGMERKVQLAKKCCTDKHQQLKSDKSNALTHSQLTLATSAVILPPFPFSVLTPYHYVTPDIRYVLIKAPPSGPDVPVFLRNRNFRI